MNSDYLSIKYLLRYLSFRTIPKFFWQFVLQKKYKNILNKHLDFERPLRLSEKIQYLKLNEKNRQKTLLSDKLEVKKYISTILPELKFAKVYQVGKCFKDIDFESLPTSFILKTNHAWKTNWYVEDKFKISKDELIFYRKSYDNVLKINYAYWSYYEMHYENITPKIFAEELLVQIDKTVGINNYEVYCFSGVPEFIQIRTANPNESIKQCVYSTNWDKLQFDISWGNLDYFPKPKFLHKMIEYSEILSKDFNFVRIDYMECNNELYFCEMTFTPASGFLNFKPNIFDLYYGHKLYLKYK